MFSRVPAKEKIMFAQTMAMMVGGGIVITRALSACQEQTKSPYFKKVLERMQHAVEGGQSLTKAIKHEENIFGSVVVHLVHAGEQSGTLGQNFETLAQWLERDARMRQEIMQATLYPKIVFGATLVVAFGLAIFILPRLIPLFSGLGMELPLATRILIAVTEFLQAHWLLTLLALVGGSIAFVLVKRISVIKTGIHFILLKLPLVGTLIQEYQQSIAFHIVGTLYASGISLPQALEAAGEACSNVQYARAFTRCMHVVEKGTKLGGALADHPGLFTSIVINTISVGEQTGKLGLSLSRLADYFSNRVSRSVKQIPTLLEPLLLIAMALIVGFIALAIILPIYEFTQGAQL